MELPLAVRPLPDGYRIKWERWESSSNQFLIEPKVLSVLLGSFLLQSHLQLKSLEGMVEKLKADLQSTDQVRFLGRGGLCMGAREACAVLGSSQAPSPDLPWGGQALTVGHLGCVGPQTINRLLLSCLFLQLKEYTSLLETQLENHLETASSERQNYTKEVGAVSVEAAAFFTFF